MKTDQIDITRKTVLEFNHLRQAIEWGKQRYCDGRLFRIRRRRNYIRSHDV